MQCNACLLKGSMREPKRISSAGLIPAVAVRQHDKVMHGTFVRLPAMRRGLKGVMPV